MERSFYNDDFDLEQLIKQKSDQYKIYPSEKVWKGIHGTIHSTRRWYWLSFVLFIGGISYIAIDQFSAPPRISIVASKPGSDQDISQTNSLPKAIILPFTPISSNLSKQTGETNYESKGLMIAMNESVKDQDEESNPLETGNDRMEAERSAGVPPLQINQTSLIDANYLVNAIPESYKEKIAAILSEKGNVTEVIAEKNVVAPDAQVVANNNELGDQKRINWLQENAVYELSRPKTKRISWQLAFSPTMNYRKLTSDKSASIASDVRNVPISFNIEGDVNNLVNHKPAMGLEIGSMFLYALNNYLTFKSGIQFNYSRYNIQAYTSYSPDRATIALNNFYGTTIDSLTTYTSLRNFGGNAVKDLKNEYYQLSAPVGFEWLVLGRGRLQFSVAGTIQPTYLINHDNYLITTDYKNYTHEPSLVRRWNVNTGAEAFVSYKAAGLKFQLGPQLRYQLLSSYDDKYPVKEFLTEYGIKFGISKAIR